MKNLYIIGRKDGDERFYTVVNGITCWDISREGLKDMLAQYIYSITHMNELTIYTLEDY